MKKPRTVRVFPALLKGHRVTWSIWGRSIENFSRNVVHHRGTIVDVIPAGILPWEVDPSYKGIAQTAAPRNHESYIVEENNKRFWPRVSGLFASGDLVA